VCEEVPPQKLEGGRTRNLASINSDVKQSAYLLGEFSFSSSRFRRDACLFSAALPPTYNQLVGVPLVE
jgi:hypothetical protein